MDKWVETFANWSPAEQRRALEVALSSSSSARQAAKEVLARADIKALAASAGDLGTGQPCASKPRAPSLIPQVDFLDVVPDVLCSTILKFLDMDSLARACCVSRRWQLRCSSPSVDDLWKAEFLRLNSDSTFIDNLKMWRNYSWRALCQLQGRSRLGWMQKSVDKRTFPGHKDRVRHVRIRTDTIVSSSWDGSLRVVNLNDETVEAFSKQVASHSGSVFGVWFDGQVAVTCSEDSTIKIWDVFQDRCVAELIGHTSAVYRVAMLSSSSEILVSCSRDFVGVWHWPSSMLLSKLQGHTHDVHRVQVSQKVIVTGSYDCTVRVWNYPSCCTQWTSPPCHTQGVSCLHFEGNTLATGSAKGEVFVWDLELGSRLHAFDSGLHNDSTISCILVAGNLVYSTSNLSLRQNDGIVCIWDVVSGMLQHKIVEPFHVNALKKDFGLVFCACSDGKLRLRRLQGFEVVRELEHGDKPLYDVDVQGPRAVTCGLDRSVVLWTVKL